VTEPSAPEGVSLRIEQPRILNQHRQSPERVTVGDESVVETPPGLIAFLALRDSRGAELGAGFSAPWTIPLGTAASAIDAAVSSPGAPSAWTTWSYTATWFRGAAADETLQAFCRVTGVTEQLVKYSLRVVGTEVGKDLLVAEGVSSSAPTQIVAAQPTPADPRVLFQTCAPQLEGGVPPLPLREGDSSEWRVPSGLLELLMNPLQGRSDPLGRRSHPLSGFQVGAAIYAARRLLGLHYEPERASVRHLRSFSEPRGECAITLGVSAVSGLSYEFTCQFRRDGEVMSHITLHMSRRGDGDKA
jgi:hypothetical protein